MNMITTVYTCDVGNYDYILPPKTDDLRLRFVCFTDNPKRRIKGWDVRPLMSPPDITDPTLINRYHKLFPHRLGFDTEWSVYVDGNMRVIGPISELVDDVIQANAVMACLKHPWRYTVEEEIVACKQEAKIQPSEFSIAMDQLHRYLRDGMPADQRLLANKVLIRNHADTNIQSAMDLWWEELVGFARRDQLSLPYVVWQTGIPITVIDKETYEQHQHFHWYGHRKNGLKGLVKYITYRKNDAGYGSLYKVLRWLKQMIPTSQANRIEK